MKKEILLELKNLDAKYDTRKILDDVSMQIDEGEIVAVMGPNGAGKSTVLKSIFGLTTITSGSVIFRSKKIKPKSHEIVLMGICYVPQGRRVFRNLTIEENLEIGAYSINDKNEIQRRIDDVMTLFPDLKTKRKDKSSCLSGGQQQMLAVARGLMMDPHLLLLDEPTLGLSPKYVKLMFDKIKEISIKRKIAVVIVEHNIKSLLGIVDRAYVLSNGKVVIEDTAENLLNSDKLEKVFLGTYTN
jgi:branched-chain amino acid transport system ATP-binding protein